MTAGALQLYSYWRSSAAYRVRIALNLKGLPYETISVHLVNNGGEQHTDVFKNLNPQELIPVLLHGSRILRQSMAIIEYLDETWPQNPLLPTTARDRQRVRALAQVIACEIHPLNNLRIQQYLEKTFKASEQQREEWTRHWIASGFEALEQLLAGNPSTGEFCEGDVPTMADCLLVPQVYNASRFKVDMTPFPTVRRINEACLAIEAFDAARPEKQPDTPAEFRID
jgi:maleylacetoacetate isomerase